MSSNDVGSDPDDQEFAPVEAYKDEPAANGHDLVAHGDQGAGDADSKGDLVQRLANFLEQKDPIEPDASLPELLNLEQMRERFVHVARGPLIVDLGNTFRRLRPGEFAAAYAHCRVFIGKQSIPITALWSQLPSRMTADAMTFNPAEGQFYEERNLRHLNVWEAPAWPPTDLSAAAPFLDHLAYLIPDQAQREDLIDWLAHAVQHPEVRPHFHFLLVATQEGTGRSWLAEVLRRMWGERHAGETDLHHLLDDQFNSVLSAKILMAVHEVKAPADERYSHRDRLKSLLTDTQITINEKHEPRWHERFCARFLLFTNRDDALPLAETDRRIYVVRCVDQPRDADYYTQLYRQKDSAALLGGLWWFLRLRNLSKFNPGKRAPLNEIKQQMIASGRTEEQQTAAEFLKACPYDVVTANDLMRLLAPQQDNERATERKARMNTITAVIRELGAQSFAKKVKVENSSVRVWMLRNGARWSVASPAAMREEATRARAHFNACHWLLDTVTEHWSRP